MSQSRIKGLVHLFFNSVNTSLTPTNTPLEQNKQFTFKRWSYIHVMCSHKLMRKYQKSQEHRGLGRLLSRMILSTSLPSDYTIFFWKKISFNIPNFYVEILDISNHWAGDKGQEQILHQKIEMCSFFPIVLTPTGNMYEK